MSERWVAALDGGGTKTALAMASREGEVLVLPEGAGCNPQDGPEWEGVLASMLSRAARAEGGLAAAALGIPGRDEVPAHDAAVDALLGQLLSCPREAMNDVALAHLGAFGGGHGVLLLAGTGSMAWARGPGGEARVGGWGHAFGDEGSAHWIGREALGCASAALDGRQPGALPFAEALCARLGPEASGPFAPLAWVMAQGSPRAAIAGVARIVDGLADGAGEASRHARHLLRGAGTHLAQAATTAASRAGLGPGFPWAASGSVFRSAVLATHVAARLGEPTVPRLTTLGGGLLRAARLAGWDVGEAWAAQVDARLCAPSP